MPDYNLSVEIVPKPGPRDDLQLCANSRDLNNKTRLIPYPILLIDDILLFLGTES